MTERTEPNRPASDTCSYELQPALQRCCHRSHQLLACLFWLTCCAFTWPGRAPHLSYVAKHGSVQERVEALRLLEEHASHGDLGSADAILAALEDDAAEVRAQAASSIAAAGGAASESRAASSLLDLAGAKQPAERVAALRSLGHTNIGQTEQATLQHALQDPEPRVRIAATQALAALAERGALADAKLGSSQLASLLSADDAELRLAAVGLWDALGRTKDPALLAARSSQLRLAARDRAPELRAAAFQAMGHARDPRLLADLQAGASDADESVRLWALSALGDSNLAGAISTLRARASGADARSASAALAALGRIDDASALPAIAAQLQRPSLAQHAADALVSRVRRLREEAVVREASEALRRAIEAARDDGVLDVLARSLVELAALDPAAHAAPVEPLASAQRDSTAAAQHSALGAARRSLLRALETGRGETSLLTRCLIALREPQLLPALIARGEHSPASALPSLFEALTTTLRASDQPATLLARHAPQLTQLLQKTPTNQPPPPPARPSPSPQPTAAWPVLQLRSLLGLETDAAAQRPEVRRALAEIWAELPDSPLPGRAEKLLAWLDDPDERVRERSSVALGRMAGPGELAALTTRLEQHAPYPTLTLQACAGALLRTAATLAGPQRERLLLQLKAYLEQPDEAIAMGALFALRASRDPRAARWIAGLLRGSSLQLRAAALQALGDFDEQDARRLLRDTLRGDNIASASSAALALAELGSDRDVEALLRAAERGSWPLQPSAAYAAARITQRAATRKHSLERSLCRFAQQRDSYAVANSVSALATLAAEACDQQLEPRKLLDPALPSALRVAAARWLSALSTQPTQPTLHATQAAEPQRAQLLSRCAEDYDRSVASACAARDEAPESAGQTLVRVFEADGHTPLRDRAVALRLPNASVYIGRSDSAGRLLFPRVLRGEILLEDPADQAASALLPRAAPESP